MSISIALRRDAAPRFTPFLSWLSAAAVFCGVQTLTELHRRAVALHPDDLQPFSSAMSMSMLRFALVSLAAISLARSARRSPFKAILILGGAWLLAPLAWAIPSASSAVGDFSIPPGLIGSGWGGGWAGAVADVAISLSPAMLFAVRRRRSASEPGTARRPRPWPAWLALAICAGAFIAIYTVHELGQQEHFRLLREQYGGGQLFMYDSVVPQVVFGLTVYLGFALAGMAMAARGRRRLFALPAAAWTFLPLVWPQSGMPRAPLGIGGAWGADATAFSTGALWQSALVDLSLALIPGCAVALWMRRHPTAERVAGRPNRRTRAHAAAFALCVLAFGIVMATKSSALIGGGTAPAVVVPLALMGILIGSERPWFPWVHLGLTALILRPDWFPNTVMGQEALHPGEITELLPFFAAPLLAVAWIPIGDAFARATHHRSHKTPRFWLIALNALNVVDALLTMLAVGRGEGVEANPVIRTIGMPGKIALVGVASVLLAKKKPRALPWLTLVLLGVLAWHLGGLLLSAATT